MKKADVLQLSIVLIGVFYGLLAAQKLLQYVYDFLLFTVTGAYNAEGFLAPLFSLLLFVCLQIAAAWILIVKSGSIADFIREKANLASGFRIEVFPAELLYMILVSIGIYLLLNNLAPILEGIFQGFRAKIPRGVSGLFEDERPIQWVRLFVDIVLPLALLILARPLANYFAKYIREEPVRIEETIDALGEDQPTDES